jgi:hypothetical protein
MTSEGINYDKSNDSLVKTSQDTLSALEVKRQSTPINPAKIARYYQR